MTQLLLAEFGSLARVLSARAGHLRRLVEDERTFVHLRAIADAVVECQCPNESAQKLTVSSAGIERFLKFRLGSEPVEILYGLFFGPTGMLLHDEVVARGSADDCPASAKEVARLALDFGATDIIIAHNHRSGDPQPSAADRAMTRRVSAVCELVDVRLHDHVIVAGNDCYSFRANGLL